MKKEKKVKTLVLMAVLICCCSIFRAQNASYIINFVPISGANNNAWGVSCLNNAGSGPGNTGIGHFNLLNNSSGEFNTSTGYMTMHKNTTGSFNCAFGARALYNNCVVNGDIGSDNVALGFSAMYANSDGDQNTVDGAYALMAATDTYYNVATGYSALTSAGAGGGAAYFNTAVGSNAMAATTTGAQNTGFGNQALRGCTTGNRTTGVGSNAVSAGFGSALTVDGNTGIGYRSMYNAYQGADNTAAGAMSLYNDIYGARNCAFGQEALYATDGDDNVGAGIDALRNNDSGEENVAIGDAALKNNFAMGGGESRNTAIGVSALKDNGGNYDNTAIGYSAGAMNNLAGYNAQENTFAGTFADMTTPLYNCGAIGYGAWVDSTDKIRIGNLNVNYYESPVNVTTSSDGRFKYNITDEDAIGLPFILKLRPVQYNFDMDAFSAFERKSMRTEMLEKMPKEDYSKANQILHTGFIAQEVEQAAKESGYEFSGVSVAQSEKTSYGLSYELFVVPLVKAVQEQDRLILQQKQIVDSLRSRIAVLKVDVNAENSQNLFSEESASQKIIILSNTKEALKMSLSGGNSNCIWRIYTIGGKELLAKASEGQSTIEFTKASIKPGIYIISAMDKGTILSSKTIAISNL